jgi:hypothetical protein
MRCGRQAGTGGTGEIDEIGTPKPETKIPVKLTENTVRATPQFQFANIDPAMPAGIGIVQKIGTALDAFPGVVQGNLLRTTGLPELLEPRKKHREKEPAPKGNDTSK